MKGGAALIDRGARIVAVVASAWFAFAAAWGMFGIPGGGHIGAGSAANTMAAEQMLRWKIIYPAGGWYTGVAPSKSDYICHHPFGQNYLLALSLWVFGHRDFVVHLPAVLMSAAMPPLLYGIAKERWGVPLGAVAAAAFVVVPIAVGFSNFTNLETVCIFGALLFFWGHSRHMTTGKRRYLLASLAGLLFVCSGDWVGYLLVAPTLAWALCRAFVLPAWATPAFRFAPYARWWALSIALVAGTFLLWVGLFYRADKIGDWLAAATMRGGGEGIPLEAVLQSRKQWLEFSFTPLAILLGRIAAPVCALRVLVYRRDEETYALGLLFGAAVQYVGFKNGADVHIFWPHYFAAYFALAFAQLVGTLASVVWGLARVLAPSRAGPAAAVTALTLGLLPALAMAHDAGPSLWVWRRTGGRYDDKGALIRSHVDMLFVLQEVVMPKTARGTGIDAHPSAHWGWEHDWKYQSQGNVGGMPASGSVVATHPFWIARGSGLSSEEQKKIAAAAHVRVYGDTWIVDQREPPAPLDAYLLAEREPNPFEWFVYGGTEPMRSIGPSPDPWLTWEWRTHLGEPADLPGGDPRTLDEMRIAHNIAVERHEVTAAERWLERLEAQLDRSVETRFTQGVRLIGIRAVGGVQPRLQAWFECTEPMAGDASFNVRSTIEARAPFSLVPPDSIVREMAWPPSLPTKLWRAGQLYKTEVVLNHRIGRERYWGYWAGATPPVRIDGDLHTTLEVLP
jgi:hypothetical protein